MAQLEWNKLDFSVMEHPWEIRDSVFVIKEKDRAMAKKFFRNAGDRMAIIAEKLGLKGIRVEFPGMNRGFQIINEIGELSSDAANDRACVGVVRAMSQSPLESGSGGSLNQTNFSMDRVADLFGADYQQIHELLLQQKSEGNIVVITSNVTHQCYHTNDNLLPSRGVFKPYQWAGYNYLQSWRRTLHQLTELQAQLARDKFVPFFEYELVRPDGAFCSYSTSYHLCQNYLGDEVRIGISRPQDWSILEPVS